MRIFEVWLSQFSGAKQWGSSQPGHDEVGDQHGRQAAKRDGQHARSIIMRGAVGVAEEAGKLDDLAQDEGVQADQRQQDCIHVLRAAAEAKTKCSRHHN